MFHTLGIKAEQVYGDMYTSWLRDTFDKSTSDNKQIFRDMVEAGFLDRQVILRRKRLGVSVMTSLGAALHRSPLTKLDVYGNALRDKGCEVVAHLMSDLPNLTYLDLGANGITGAGARSLGFAVAQHPKLTVLLLASRRVSDPYPNDINASYPGTAVLLQGCLRSRTLRQLDLSGNHLGEGASGRSRATAGDGEAAAQGAGGATAGGGDAESGGGGGGLLEPDDDAEDSGATGQTTSQQPQSPLDLLSLILAKPTVSLTSLRLRDTSLRSTDAIQLIDALHANTSLTTLDLSENNLPACVGDALGRLLLDRSAMQSHCSLTTLRLSGNPILRSEAAAETEAAPSKAAALPFTTHSGRQSPAPPTPSLLLSALASDRLITTLELNRCAMDGEAMQTLCRSLMTNTSLTCLSLRDNKIGMESAVELGRALCRHPCLRKLYLSGNEVGDEGACALAAVVEGERSLEMLHAAGAPVDGSSVGPDAIFAYTFESSVSQPDGGRTVSMLDRALHSTPDGAGSPSAGAGRAVSFAVGRGSGAAQKRGGSASPRRRGTGKDGSRRGSLSGGGAGQASSGSTLEVLDLRRTWLGDRGLVSLGVALQGTSSLRVLLLGGNHFSSQGGETFTSLLERNESVVLCDLGATSVPCPTVLRLERCVSRNRERLEHAESDALRRERIRLHFQQYKLEEAKIELEALRERSANTRTAADNFDLQFKQDQSDYGKKLRDLEEQTETYTTQKARYEQQAQQLEADLAKIQGSFEEEMAAARERLEAEIKIREKVEEEFRQVEAELEEWRRNPQGREQARRERVVEVREEMVQWGNQRKQYRQDAEKLQQEVSELEAKYAAMGGGKGKKGSVSKAKAAA